MTFSAGNGWGPDAKRAALCLTFDNLGEAGEIETGSWGDKPVGKHYTSDFVPVLIEALGDMRATYFIEGSNAEIYPDAVKTWHESGNEVALHAWRHEFWAKCDGTQRRDILRKSIRAVQALGINPEGFRPPGGAIPERAWEEFQEAGLLYCSDLANSGIQRFCDVISLPFSWFAVDAFYFEPVGAPLRKQLGFEEAGHTPTFWADVLDRIAAKIVETGTQATIIFHPYILASDPEKFSVFTDFVRKVRDNEDIWVARATDVAHFVAQPRATASAAGRMQK